MKRVYVAGSYSANSVIAVFDNIRNGIKASVSVLQLGYSPFCPWLDFQFALTEHITLEQYYRYSMAWLEVSDAVLVLPDSEQSKGTQAEIERAKQLNIPIVYSFNELENTLMK
jgi:hypothetical protein